MTALVYSAAIAAGHAELDAARRLGVPVLRRHQALSLYASLFGQVVAVAGGAGKTSTSAVLAAILTATSWQPTVYLGARSPNLEDRNYRHGQRRLLIAEADEYRDAFLDLPRHIGIIGPVIDYDHRDYFGPGRPVTESFTAFAADLDLAVADADNLAALQAARAARTVISVGTSPDADYRITNIQPARGDWQIEDRHGHTVLAPARAAPRPGPAPERFPRRHHRPGTRRPRPGHPRWHQQLPGRVAAHGAAAQPQRRADARRLRPQSRPDHRAGPRAARLLPRPPG